MGGLYLIPHSIRDSTPSDTRWFEVYTEVYVVHTIIDVNLSINVHPLQKNIQNRTNAT